MEQILLELNDLSKTYGRIKAVNQLTFTLKKGHSYALLGPNGIGKSTTLGMILNVVNPTSETFRWFDGQLSTTEALKKIGAIIERPNFYPYMTALQNLELICKIKQCSQTPIQEKLELVGLWERKDSKFSTFSLGMKQRLAIAAALINNPELLILDEPTNGLDPEGIHQIRKLIKKIAAEGTTILLTSHLLDEVEKICSHVIILKEGVKYYEGTVNGIHKSYGYFELKAENLELLKQFLEKLDEIDRIEEENNLLIAYLKTNLNTEKLSAQLAKEKIYITHLAHKKPSLEEQFLNLTQKN